MRLLMHLKNDKINAKFLSSLCAASSSVELVVDTDELGRAFITQQSGSCQKTVLLQKKNKSADLPTAAATTTTETKTVTSDAVTSPSSETNTSPAGHNLHQGVSSEVFNVFDFKDLAPVRSSWDLKIPDSIYDLLVFRSDSDKATLMTPHDAPFKLDKEDLRHLLPDKEIVGQVLDGLLLVFYLDPMYSLASSNRVRKDLDIVNRIIWHRVLLHDEDESVPETLDDWNYVTSTTFKYVLGQDLPKQTRGLDCGLWCVMYAFYLSMHAQFDFDVNDMRALRKWALGLLMVCSNNEVVIEHVNWISDKMESDRRWSLPFTKKK